MTGNKTVETAASVPAFLNSVADETRRAEAKALVKVFQAATSEKPKMWGPAIVGFGSYHYVYDTGREGDMPVAGFSPRKAASVLYIMTGFAGYEALLAKAGKFTASKGCLYIKKLADVDLKALEKLIAASAAARRKKTS